LAKLGLLCQCASLFTNKENGAGNLNIDLHMYVFPLFCFLSVSALIPTQEIKEKAVSRAAYYSTSSWTPCAYEALFQILTQIDFGVKGKIWETLRL
jgi:hypothetical protein